MRTVLESDAERSESTVYFVMPFSVAPAVSVPQLPSPRETSVPSLTAKEKVTLPAPSSSFPRTEKEAGEAASSASVKSFSRATSNVSLSAVTTVPTYSSEVRLCIIS